jgi:uncharacterized protein
MSCHEPHRGCRPPVICRKYPSEDEMGFEQFGIVSFTGMTKTEQFVEFLKNNEMRATVCKSCGKKFFPPRSDCDACFSNDMDWFPISGEGTLITYTRAMYAPAGFEKDVPYTLGVAEFPEGVHVFGRLDKNLAEDAIKPGMKVKIRIIDLGDDRFSYELTGS